MKRGKENNWRKREENRAALLHRVFSKISKKGLKYRAMYRQARHLGAGRHLNSYSNFERIFLAWRKSPSPETILRKWQSVTPETSAVYVPAVILLAVHGRVTLREAHTKLALPLSYNTVFRHCRVRDKIARLAAIRRTKERLAKEEATILSKLKGGTL